MDTSEVRKRLAEFAATREPPGTDPVAQVEAALFVEETFSLHLSDDDLNETNFGSHEALEAFVLNRLGVK